MTYFTVKNMANNIMNETYEVFETTKVGRAGPSVPPVVWEALSE